MRKLETFSKTLQHATQFTKQPGTIKGTCCICGEQTTQGNKKKFGNNFTCADYISSGDCVCEYCQHLISNSNTYRRSMYLLTENEFKTFKKKDIKNIIFNLPENQDFYLYLTKTWQKLGYILMNKARNTKNNNNITVVIDYDIITYNKQDLQQKYKLVQKFRELKIGKENLEQGNLRVHHYRRLVEEYDTRVAREMYEKLKKNTGNPVWDLAIYVSD